MKKFLKSFLKALALFAATLAIEKVLEKSTLPEIEPSKPVNRLDD